MSTNRLEAVETKLAAALERVGVTRVCEPDRAVRLVEFSVVGLTGAALNVALFLWVAAMASYLIAGTVAFASTVFWTFALNWLVTFERPDRLARRFVRYLGVYAVGFVIYMLTLTAGLQVLALPYWLSDLGAVAGGGLVNYIGSERYALR